MYISFLIVKLVLLNILILNNFKSTNLIKKSGNIASKIRAFKYSTKLQDLEKINERIKSFINFGFQFDKFF